MQGLGTERHWICKVSVVQDSDQYKTSSQMHRRWLSWERAVAIC